METSGFDTSDNSGIEPGGDGSITSGDPWVDTTVDSGDLLEDFSGCTWSSTLFEFPPWIENLEKTMSDYDMQYVICLPNEPLTPSKVVFCTSRTG